MTESLKLPNMYMTPLGAVYNHLDSGAIQVIHGVRMQHLSGLYERAKEDTFIVNIPIDDTGNFVSREISQVMALYIDWILVNAQIVNCWKTKIITSKSLNTLDIQQILLRCDIVNVEDKVGVVKDEYIYQPPHEEMIDSTISAVPIHKVKIENIEDNEE